MSYGWSRCERGRLEESAPVSLCERVAKGFRDKQRFSVTNLELANRKSRTQGREIGKIEFEIRFGKRHNLEAENTPNKFDGQQFG